MTRWQPALRAEAERSCSRPPTTTAPWSRHGLAALPGDDGAATAPAHVREHRPDGLRPVRIGVERHPGRAPRRPAGPRAGGRDPAAVRGCAGCRLGAAPGRRRARHDRPTRRPPGCIAAGEVAAVLVGADRIAANGDLSRRRERTRSPSQRARPACRSSCVRPPRRSTRRRRRRGGHARGGPAGAVMRAAGTRIAPEGSQIRNPAAGRDARALVTALVTEEGSSGHRSAAAIAGAVASASGPAVGRRPGLGRASPHRPPATSGEDAALMATVALGRRAAARSSPGRPRTARCLRDVPRAGPPVRRLCDLRPRRPRVRPHAVGDRDRRRRRRRRRAGVRRAHAAAAVRDGPRRRDRGDPARRHPAARRLPRRRRGGAARGGPQLPRRARARRWSGCGSTAPASGPLRQPWSACCRSRRRAQPPVPARLRRVAAVERRSPRASTTASASTAGSSPRPART